VSEKPKEYFRYECQSWRLASASEACTGCAKSVCLTWKKIKLTPAEVQQIQKAKK
jgi:hypothetical protein